MFFFAANAASDAAGAAKIKKIFNHIIITKKFLFLIMNFKEIKIKTIK